MKKLHTTLLLLTALALAGPTLAQTASAHAGHHPATDQVAAADRGEIPGRVNTGFDIVDSATGGLAPGELVYVAARVGTGKSVFAGQAADAIAATKTPVLVFTMEMTDVDMAMRNIRMARRACQRKVTSSRATHSPPPADTRVDREEAAAYDASSAIQRRGLR